MAKLIQVTRDGDVVVITLANAAKRNALSIPMRLELIEALEALQIDDYCRAIVVRGLIPRRWSSGPRSRRT